MFLWNGILGSQMDAIAGHYTVHETTLQDSRKKIVVCSPDLSSRDVDPSWTVGMASGGGWGALPEVVPRVEST